MDYFKALLFLQILTIACLQSVEVGESFVVKEHDQITFECTTPADYNIRKWYRGFANHTVNNEQNALFAQINGFEVVRKPAANARGDMEIDAADDDTFSLTIGRSQIEDNSLFTCRMQLNAETFTYINLTVYTTSEPNLSLIADEPIRVGDNVDISCSVDRVYPKLSDDSFFLNFNDEKIQQGEPENNQDGTYKYSIRHMKTATKELNNKEITCLIDPEFGDTQSSIKELKVVYKPEGKPSVTVDGVTDVYLEDDVTLTCDSTRVVPGNPQDYTYTWYLNGQPLDNKKEEHSFEASDKSGGNYTCSFSNSQGETEKSDALAITVKAVTNPSKPSVLPAAVGGAVGFVVVIIIIVIVVVICQKRKDKRLEKEAGSSTSKLTRNGNLDHVITPPPAGGEAQYSDVIAPAPNRKPIPAKRSFKKPPPQPIYSEAHPNYRGVVGPGGEQPYSNIETIYAEAGIPGQGQGRPDIANNNDDDNPKVVYAQLDLLPTGKNAKPGRPEHRVTPTEYARIDFKQGARV